MVMLEKTDAIEKILDEQFGKDHWDDGYAQMFYAFLHVLCSDSQLEDIAEILDIDIEYYEENKDEE